MSWDVQVSFLSKMSFDVFRCLVCWRLGPVNLWMHSLFSDVSISLNENQVSPPTSLYPFFRSTWFSKYFSWQNKSKCSFPVICTAIRRVEVKVDTIPRGNMNYVQDNMFLGQLPKRLVIGCVDSDTLNGTITKIPFDFRHCKINFVALNVNESPYVNCPVLSVETFRLPTYPESDRIQIRY
jgi:hypothetical protein